MPEDAQALADELIPGNILKDFGDANWKIRLAALEEATTWLEGLSYDVDAEVVVRAFAQKGWNEKNFQVSCVPLPWIVSLISAPIGFGEIVHNSVSARREDTIVWEVLCCSLCASLK
jgi:hypothetical protein